MTDFTADDHRYMALALRLARRGLYSTHPNPRVGCVIVRNGTVVGEGWHRAAGEAHAEVNALMAAAGNTRGGTAFVTLEPCSHTGRTGPCARALIDAGLQRVVCAMPDPFPAVGGDGIRQLQDAGIETTVGLMQVAARELNPGFLSRIERGRPFLRLKLAVSQDGATAMAGGESQWITGEAARRDVQRWRARSDAILTGIGTVLADDPRLTVRGIEGHRRQPLRVVADSRLRTPPAARLLQAEGDVVVFCTDDQQRDTLESAGATVCVLDGSNGQCRLDQLLERLGVRGVNEVLVECGPALAGALLEQQLVDELVIYQAPHLLGSNTLGAALTPSWQTLAARQPLEIVERRQFGPDTRIIARPAA